MPLLRWIAPEGGEPVWWPLKPEHSEFSPQRTGLESPAKFVLYGGGSGGGKSDWLVADAAQEHENPNFRGVLLRKSFREMTNLIDRMKAIYRPLGARSTEKDTVWKFPSGASLRLGYLASDGDVENYQGTPFSWLGVDEAGNHVETRIRRLLPWLASTDPTLNVRCRLTANPGGVGADWLMHVFLRNKCPIHFPDESVEAGAVYGGKKLTWTDGKPVGMTVSFIPALVGDNPLYGQEKIDVLKTQEGPIAEKLLIGCWCELAGRYWSFLNPSFNSPLAETPHEWWNTYIIATDYGFGESWAAAGLFFLTEPSPQYPQGRMIQIAEYIGLNAETGVKPGSEEFAQTLMDMWVVNGDQRRTISMAICDPATDGHTGNHAKGNIGRSNMEIMAEVFEGYGISTIGAHKDRVSNFQNLFRMLKKRQLVITDACPATFKALSTRMHDPNRPGDIKKVKGSSLDDLTDMVSYAANTYFAGESKPGEVRQAEKLQQMAKSGMDEHSLNVNRLKMLMDMQNSDEEAPTRMTRVGMNRVIRRG
jgi:hypothetical protein